jgi:hypothetical protein
LTRIVTPKINLCYNGSIGSLLRFLFSDDSCHAWRFLVPLIGYTWLLPLFSPSSIDVSPLSWQHWFLRCVT